MAHLIVKSIQRNNNSLMWEINLKLSDFELRVTGEI